MKKRFVCMLLVLAVTALMAVTASAQSADTALPERESAIANPQLSRALQLAQIHEATKENSALLEEIIARELANADQEIPWMIQIYEALEDSALLEQLQESPQAICVYIWYDEAGNRIDDPELIAELWSTMVSRGPAGQSCCDNPSHVTYYYEEHLYEPPAPARCTFQRTELVVCQNCGSTISRAVVEEGTHTHE